jgi:hypothetical protein
MVLGITFERSAGGRQRLPLPRSPLDDPRCGTIQALGPGLEAAFEGMSKAIDRALAVVVPHVGVRALEGTDLVLSWPWSLPFGSPIAETVIRRFCVEDVV